MKKPYRHLWLEVTSFENLSLAFQKAARGKRSRPAAAAFEFDLEHNLIALQSELRGGAYQPGGYASFRIHDPKRRLISAAPFRDRVVHHALCNVIGPLFGRQFIYDSYANQVGKGTHRALDRCTYYLRRFEYLLPLDVRQFFPSIDHAILETILAQTIGDEHVLELCRRILASGQGVLAGEYEMVYFADDDLFAVNRPRGLPIGNLTSQFWANVYLNGLDHFIKRTLKCRGYERYVDDMLLFSNSKAELLTWRSEVIHFLAGLRLTLHPGSAQPRPCRSGGPFLGFQVFRDHRRLKRPKVIQARRRLKHYAERCQRGELAVDQVSARVASWIAHISHGDTWGLRQAILDQVKFQPSSGGKLERETISDLHQNL